MKIGLISDTHSYWDEKILEYFKDVDEIWHAGDIGENEVLEKLKSFKPTKAVFGNIETQEKKRVLPEYLFEEINQCKILMIHIAGTLGKYNSKTQKLIKDFKPHILICGHSHILKVMFDSKFDLLYINPGAAGNHGFHVEKTLLKFEINNAKPENLQLIKLGQRGKYYE